MHPKKLLLFTTSSEKVSVSVTFKEGTFWLSQKAIAELFGVKVPAISKHLKNIFETGELDESSTVSKMEIVHQEGKTVQNKLHWAITGQTAAEIIYTEADATKLYMGLKTWKAAPDGKIMKSDVAVAKNYLSHQHIAELNRVVSAYLDLAENNAQRGLAFNMQQWAKFLDGFLELSNYPILTDKGKVTMLEAKLKAEQEYDKFRVIQDQTYESDFDKEVKKLKP